jgi:glycosyltransferase involved in cell wall biosynthesis
VKLLMLTKYGPLAASTRTWFHQYVSYLERAGIDVSISPLLDDDYLRRLYGGQPISKWSVLRGYLRRLRWLLRAGSFDLLWIQFELLPYLPAWAERWLSWRGIPYVVNYDDALFHRYDRSSNPLVRLLLSKKIATVMRHSALVIAGNAYLADYAHNAGASRVEQLPTVIDLERYTVKPAQATDVLTIGWIGSLTTTPYLKLIEDALSILAKESPIRLLLVGAGPLSMDSVPVEQQQWTEATEVDSIHRMDIGVMPLEDTVWERGKCGYKLIQYMACGLPVVSSAVGVNTTIVDDGENGFLATTTDEWLATFRALRDSVELRQRMGMAGRRKVEARYNTDVTAPRLIHWLREVAR